MSTSYKPSLSSSCKPSERKRKREFKTTDSYLSQQNINDQDWLYFFHFPFLTSIHLDYNNLTYIPVEIQQLVNLELLNLYNNQLEDIENVCRLPNLTVLLVSHNKLTELPDSLFTLPKLKVLECAHNYIKSIPSTISWATSLKRLNLCCNGLEWIPYSICDLPRLTDIRLNRNKLSMVPIDLKVQIGFNENSPFECTSLFLNTKDSSYIRRRRLYGITIKDPKKFYFNSKQPKFIRIGVNGDDSLVRSVTSIDHSLFETYISQQEVYCDSFDPIPVSGPNMLTEKDEAYKYDRANLPNNFQECLSLSEWCGRTVRTNEIYFNNSTLPLELLSFLQQFRKCVCGKYYHDYNCIIVEYVAAGPKHWDLIPAWKPICSISCARKNGYIHWNNISYADETKLIMEEERDDKEEKKFLVDLFMSLQVK